MGCGKNIARLMVDAVSLRCQVDWLPSGNVKQAGGYVSVGLRQEVKGVK